MRLCYFPKTKNLGKAPQRSSCVVAAKLIEEPGAVVQLNMSEGKTPAIVQMLISHWVTGDRLLRVGVLSVLLDEMYASLRRRLCASVLGRHM